MAAKSGSIFGQARCRPANVRAASVSTASSQTSHGTPPVGGVVLSRQPGTTIDRALVLTVSVAGSSSVPFNVTDAGETLQLPCGGAPEQVSEISLLNPPMGLSVTV